MTQNAQPTPTVLSPKSAIAGRRQALPEFQTDSDRTGSSRRRTGDGDWLWDLLPCELAVLAIDCGRTRARLGPGTEAVNRHRAGLR